MAHSQALSTSVSAQPRLGGRDKELLALLADQKNNAEIASTLGIEESEVWFLMVDLSKRLGLDHRNKRVALGCVAVRLGLVKP